jgi:hypothetical protein
MRPFYSMLLSLLSNPIAADPAYHNRRKKQQTNSPFGAGRCEYIRKMDMVVILSWFHRLGIQ